MKPGHYKSTAHRKRRAFLAQVGAFASVSLFGFTIRERAEPPPEIIKIGLKHAPAMCRAPQYLAEELLRREGFTGGRR
jgi:NitT/TauT family transport system substrate-binding protein